MPELLAGNILARLAQGEKLDPIEIERLRLELNRLQGAPGATSLYGLTGDYILIRDEKAQNTAGGTFTSGAWRTRTLNTEVTDAGNWATLAANQITLLPGTYRFQCGAPTRLVGVHQTRFQNITTGVTVAVGTSEYDTGAAPGPSSRSRVQGRFAIASASVFELQHQCQTTRATDGFGIAANFTTEVYAVCEFWRERS